MIYNIPLSDLHNKYNDPSYNFSIEDINAILALNFFSLEHSKLSNLEQLKALFKELDSLYQENKDLSYKTLHALSSKEFNTFLNSTDFLNKLTFGNIETVSLVFDLFNKNYSDKQLGMLLSLSSYWNNHDIIYIPNNFTSSSIYNDSIHYQLFTSYLNKKENTMISSPLKMDEIQKIFPSAILVDSTQYVLNDLLKNTSPYSLLKIQIQEKLKEKNNEYNNPKIFTPNFNIFEILNLQPSEPKSVIKVLKLSSETFKNLAHTLNVTQADIEYDSQYLKKYINLPKSPDPKFYIRHALIISALKHCTNEALHDIDVIETLFSQNQFKNHSNPAFTPISIDSLPQNLFNKLFDNNTASIKVLADEKNFGYLSSFIFGYDWTNNENHFRLFQTIFNSHLPHLFQKDNESIPGTKEFILESIIKHKAKILQESFNTPFINKEERAIHPILELYPFLDESYQKKPNVIQNLFNCIDYYLNHSNLNNHNTTYKNIGEQPYMEHLLSLFDKNHQYFMDNKSHIIYQDYLWSDKAQHSKNSNLLTIYLSKLQEQFFFQDLDNLLKHQNTSQLDNTFWKRLRESQINKANLFETFNKYELTNPLSEETLIKTITGLIYDTNSKIGGAETPLANSKFFCSKFIDYLKNKSPNIHHTNPFNINLNNYSVFSRAFFQFPEFIYNFDFLKSLNYDKTEDKNLFIQIASNLNSSSSKLFLEHEFLKPFFKEPEVINILKNKKIFQQSNVNTYKSPMGDIFNSDDIKELFERYGDDYSWITISPFTCISLAPISIRGDINFWKSISFKEHKNSIFSYIPINVKSNPDFFLHFVKNNSSFCKGAHFLEQVFPEAAYNNVEALMLIAKDFPNLLQELYPNLMSTFKDPKNPNNTTQTLLSYLEESVMKEQISLTLNNPTTPKKNILKF
jgi:hypothetical protein